MAEAPRERMRCAFIHERPCAIQLDEIPLDVCRLCVDAWKTYIDHVRRPALKQLRRLDKLFEEGQIGVEEYIKRKMGVLESI